ncbi:hypothetical protein ABW20_dc0108267 [Dactylellina cionopaga]|nr:hypothetical protein ABW20_dc0108267 [Dactylellina cionopaga]
MDSLPPEILLQIFKHFDPYTVLTRLRPVSKSFSYAAAILNPSLKIAGLPPSLWEKVLSNVKTYKTLYHISRCDSSFRSLVRSTSSRQLQATAFRLPLPSSTISNEEKEDATGTPFPTVSKVVEHPAFENICCRIEHGSLIYHKTGNNCPTDLLSFPMSEENATNPPVGKVLVRFSARYGVTLRPVLITKDRDNNHSEKTDGKPGGGVTVGDVYRAMKRLFVEPLTEKQTVALKEMRDWEAKKHEAVKKAVSKIEREVDSAAEAAASSAAAGSNTDSVPLAPAPKIEDEAPELPKEPVIKHDESEICFEQPMTVEFKGHSGDQIQRQREFLYDFPYVYASAHMGGHVNGAQVFVLTYH